jgi:hypothetical protein
MAVVTVAVAVSLAIPAAAAADRYVDAETGSGTACTIAQPCADVSLGESAAAPGETIRVDQGTYGGVTLGDGKVLLADDFVGSDTGVTLLQGVGVMANETGTVTGFTIRQTVAPPLNVSPGGSVIATDNVFDAETNPLSTALLRGGASTLVGNTFIDPPGSDDDSFGIEMTQGGDHTITGNSFEGYEQAIRLEEATTAEITGNQITAARPFDAAGIGIRVTEDSYAEISRNVFSEPLPGDTLGVSLTEDTTTPEVTGLTMDRNRIDGFTTAIDLNGADGGVKLNSDLLTNNAIGIRAGDVASTPGDVDATNVTIWGSSTSDATLFGSHLTLDSSILGTGIGGPGHTGSCTIAHSRGPTTTGDSCSTFQTTAVPNFVNAAGGDYRLTGSNPALLDLGNPAAPVAPNTLDLDGDPRALDATPACSGNVPRRDIGADEFVAALPTCAPPGGGATTPPSRPKKKKCKKRKAKKGAAAAKKVCKRKKR